MTKRVLLLALLLCVSACSSVKRELGVDRNSPDEFMVVKRAPLTLPPDYTLRPPSATGSVPDSTATEAETAVFGKTPAPAAKNESDSVFLNKLGADNVSADIRAQIDAENGYIAVQNRTVADKLIYWNDANPPLVNDKDASVIDAAAEAERLKQNKAAGKPLNQGVVPVIEKKKSTLDKIF